MVTVTRTCDKRPEDCCPIHFELGSIPDRELETLKAETEHLGKLHLPNQMPRMRKLRLEHDAPRIL